jgi:hypothetical protein
MFKLAPYLILLIGLLVVPVLEKIALQLEAKAKQTPEEWDDIAAGAFRTVIEFFKTPDIFVPRK